jgi:protein-disulfide isomerase
MAQYDASIADPKSLERIKFDFEAGRALGVTGTPTFFINDEKLELSSFDDLDRAIADALGT